MKSEAPVIRPAKVSDLPEIVRLLAEDDIVGDREKPTDPLSQCYHNAFASIEADANNELIVAELDGRVIGTIQITYIPYIIFQGNKRALFEALIVSEDMRGNGIGTALMEWCIDRARQRGCRIVELASNKKRKRAHVFYKRLGFEMSHEGFKLEI